MLTKFEREAFETAWMFMERVGGMYPANGEPERWAGDIVVHDRWGKASPLPPKVVEMVGRLGGLRKTNAYFNGMTKEKYFDKFIERMMSRREQPRDYFVEGTLYFDDRREHTPEIVVYDEEREGLE
ncbi:hypothetical protein [Hydrogenimonas sp.]